MSYQITFRDRTTRIIDNEKGERLKAIKAMPRSKWPLVIDLGDDQFDPYEVVSIKKAFTPVDMLSEPSKAEETNSIRLPSGVICRSEHAINLAVIHVATKHKKVKELKDPAWRKAVREKLWEQRQDWCDTEKGTCGCEYKEQS